MSSTPYKDSEFDRGGQGKVGKLWEPEVEDPSTTGVKPSRGAKSQRAKSQKASQPPSESSATRGTSGQVSRRGRGTTTGRPTHRRRSTDCSFVTQVGWDLNLPELSDQEGDAPIEQPAYVGFTVKETADVTSDFLFFGVQADPSAFTYPPASRVDTDLHTQGDTSVPRSSLSRGKRGWNSRSRGRLPRRG